MILIMIDVIYHSNVRFLLVINSAFTSAGILKIVFTLSLDKWRKYSVIAFLQHLRS